MSKPTLADLMEARAKIEHEIATAQREERAGAIAQIKRMMAEQGVTVADLTGKPAVISKGASLKGVSIAPRYRGPNGETWTGRGLQPRWLKAAIDAGTPIEKFKIAA